MDEKTKLLELLAERQISREYEIGLALAKSLKGSAEKIKAYERALCMFASSALQGLLATGAYTPESNVVTDTAFEIAER